MISDESRPSSNSFAPSSTSSSRMSNSKPSLRKKNKELENLKSLFSNSKGVQVSSQAALNEHTGSDTELSSKDQNRETDWSKVSTTSKTHKHQNSNIYLGFEDSNPQGVEIVEGQPHLSPESVRSMKSRKFRSWTLRRKTPGAITHKICEQVGHHGQDKRRSGLKSPLKKNSETEDNLSGSLGPESDQNEASKIENLKNDKNAFGAEDISRSENQSSSRAQNARPPLPKKKNSFCQKLISNL